MNINNYIMVVIPNPFAIDNCLAPVTRCTSPATPKERYSRWLALRNILTALNLELRPWA